MQTYHVKLQSPISTSYRCKRAADSLDIDVKKKSIHELKISADLQSGFNVGLMIGASGSGKTTLAKSIFGQDCFQTILDPEKPIIDQFPEHYDYETCANILSGVGLTQVVCWIRPVKTLSNGQRSRAEAALLMCRDGLTVIDEWTSVVDRTVAKVMSHCIQKHARKEGRSIVLLSCHYDVIDWLNPDWVIDCNQQSYQDRRLLWRGFKRPESICFDIRRVGREAWPYFSKYHYLSERIAGGKSFFFGLFHGKNQIGFIAYTNYVPKRKGKKTIMHSNRIVIHPDYAGMGLGLKLSTETAKIMAREGYRVMVKLSSIPLIKAKLRDQHWKLKQIKRQIGKMQLGGKMARKSGFRENIKTYSFEYTGNL